MITPTSDSQHLSEKLQVLWAGIQRKESQSLTDLYRLMYSDLLNFGILFGHEASVTKDAVNQIFLELWERAENLASVVNVRSYLITYLRRKLLRDYEFKSRFVDLPETESISERSYEEILISVQQEEHMKQRLKQALDQLTPRQKELIQMRFFEEMSNEAISQQTGMHINTVYNTMSSALKTLRQRMEAPSGPSLSGWWPLLLLLWQSAEKIAAG